MSGRFLAAAVAFLTAAAMTLVLVPSTTANAATNTYYRSTLYASQAKVLTSTGQRVRVDLTASEWGKKHAEFTVTVRQGAESHTWTFPIRHRDFDLSTNGRGELVLPKSAISPFDKIKLKIRKDGRLRSQTCQGWGGVEDKVKIGKRRHLKVSGTFWFKTKSGTRKTDWGKIGSKTAKLTFKTKAKGVWIRSKDQSDCAILYEPCVTQVTWGVERRKVSLLGEGRKVTGQRNVNLTKPRHATRTDKVSAWAKSATFTRNDADMTASIAVQGNGNSLTGSATLKGKRNWGAGTVWCDDGMMSRMSWYGSYTNGPTPLRLKDIFGTITSPKTVDSLKHPVFVADSHLE